jgi:hypothetical protein
VPGIHEFLIESRDVDGRDKPGHDNVGIDDRKSRFLMRALDA